MSESIFVKFEIKDEPIDDYSLNLTDCSDNNVSHLSSVNGSESNCYESLKIDCDDTKVGLETPGGFENVMVEEKSRNSEEIYNIPIKKELDNSPLSSLDCTVGTGKILVSNIDAEELKNEFTKIDIVDIQMIKNVNCRSNEDLKNAEHCDKYADFNKQSSVNKKLHQCKFCEMCFNHLGSFNRHTLIHTGEKSHQCDICKMCFRQSVHLKKHKLIHAGVKPYQCNICKKFFRVPGTLKKHKLIHTGEKPYQCDICKLCFRESGCLRKHNLIHTGEKPYQCDICKIAFRGLSTLKTHKLIHTGEKPFQCNICKRWFRGSSTLKSHMFTHTGEKPYQCNVCKKFFRQAGVLKKHALLHK